ncbi:MAG: hypothetical protein WC489_00835 [Patescibacteria group bacterium]
MRSQLKSVVIYVSSFFISTLFFISFFLHISYAQTPPPSQINHDPLPCSMAPGLGNCPTDLKGMYAPNTSEPCVSTYAEFMENPLQNHYWALDAEITAQGKADERARHFIYWAISKSAIDNHPTLRIIWDTTKNVALFLFILVAALFGLGLMISQKSNFNLKVEVWPIISKIMFGLLYIVFSYAFVIFLVQISEILMKFFIETLGGDKLFNIYFTGSVSQESSYVDFVGCRDLNYRVREAVEAEVMLLKITNITYYVMGVMLILRKILLWFLLFVAPFLALLMPFVFIRNIGWIWIGTFFQWLFYGPLFALFLGAMATIWRNGIPYPFDFSRTHSLSGYIYPTGINLTYGGPAQIGAQRIGPLNTGNYIDTYAEYIITLIMQWAVIFFPWWLLRIFRDYCCDGIYAMKNILMSMYDQTRGAPGPKPPSPTHPSPTSTGTAMKMPKSTDMHVKVRLETMEDVKKTRTEEISKSLNLSMNKITDIARFETNKQTHETVKKNLEYLASPTKAETPTERQKFMNIRTELFNRTVKEDRVAKQILSSISSSRMEQTIHKEKLISSVPQTSPITQVVSYKTNVSQDKVSSVSNSFVSSISANNNLINKVSTSSNVSAPQVQTVLTSYKQNMQSAFQASKTINTVSAYSPSLAKPGATSVKQMTVPPAQIVTNISKETGIEKEKVITVIKETSKVAVADQQTIKEIAQKENLKEEQVRQIIATQTPLVTELEKNIEQTVSIPPSVSIEDYEEVKKMWVQQYEKGEVPVSENLSSREEWLEQDILFITNTLNKLMSSDEKLKNQGVDDLGYILPIFLINNLKGEELAVYLKAKLEAAKHVKEMKDMEKQITAKLKEKSKDEEDLVELKKPAVKEEAKHMEVAQELDIPEEDKKEEKPTEEKTPLSIDT